MTEQACPGSCNSRYRRLRAEHDKAVAAYDPLDSSQSRPEPPAVQPSYGDPWCGRCKAVIHAELAELDDVSSLLASRPPLDVPGSDEDKRAGRVSGTRERKSPSPRMDVLDELGDWLRDSESAFRGADPPARRGYLATERTTIIAWLADHFDAHITHPGLAADYGAEIRRWHRELASLSRAGTVDKHLHKPCPRCNMYTLWVRDGEDYVRCIDDAARGGSCGRRMTRAEYRDYADKAA